MLSRRLGLRRRRPPDDGEIPEVGEISPAAFYQLALDYTVKCAVIGGVVYATAWLLKNLV